MTTMTETAVLERELKRLFGYDLLRCSPLDHHVAAEIGDRGGPHVWVIHEDKVATLAERLAAYPSDWREIAVDQSTRSRLPWDDLDELSVACTRP